MTEITGSASAIATAMGSSGISDAADVTATVDAGSAAAADLNTIDSNTETAVAATAVTEITGSASAIATAMGSTGINDAADVRQRLMQVLLLLQI